MASLQTRSVAAAAALAFALVAQAAPSTAPPPQPAKTVAAPMPAGFPTDVPMPPAFTIHSLVQTTKAQWRSREGLDALVAATDHRMQDAGWNGHVVKQAPPASSRGDFEKAGRVVHLQFAVMPQGAGTRVTLEADTRLRPGDTLATHTQLPEDVFQPSPAQTEGLRVQTTAVAFRVAMLPERVAEAYRNALHAGGWELQKDSSAQGLRILTSHKGQTRSTIVTIRPSQDGTGSELDVTVSELAP